MTRLHDITPARPTDLFFTSLHDGHNARDGKPCPWNNLGNHHDCAATAMGRHSDRSVWVCECKCVYTSRDGWTSNTAHYFVGERHDTGYICPHCLAGRCPQ